MENSEERQRLKERFRSQLFRHVELFNAAISTGKGDWVVKAAFDKLFEKFKNSILVVSYRSDGIPSIEELNHLLRKHKPDVKEIKRKNYKYVLSHNHSEEVLLIGK